MRGAVAVVRALVIEDGVVLAEVFFFFASPDEAPRLTSLFLTISFWPAILSLIF
jgi:hypothetical protein